MYKLFGIINYIVVIFLNAFTDLGHKIIVQNTIFKIYDGNTQIVLTATLNALALLPYILIFSPSGFLADKFPKNKILEHSAFFAFVLTLAICYAYYNGLFVAAFLLTFFLGLQSAIFAPAKYGYIKELVGTKYISNGNAAVQAATTVAILGGIIFYTVLFETLYTTSAQTTHAILKLAAPLSFLLVLGTLVEWFLARKLPNKMDKPSDKKFKFKKYMYGNYFRKNIKIIKRKPEIVEAIIALSLFWSISQVVLAIFGEYAKSELAVTNTIFIQGVMALAGIGIIAGSMIAAKFSKYFIHTGFAGMGVFGLTILVFLIPFMKSMVVIALLFALFGIFSGFLMVPLNARIQLISPRVHLGTVLAGNNFIQNIFMFSFLILTTLFAYFGMNTQMLFYLMGFVGICLSYIVLQRHFIKTLWALVRLLFSFGYKFHYEGLENIPKDKGVLLISNHVSWIDWAILQFPFKRDVNYMMDKEIYNFALIHRVCKMGKVIPVSPKASKDAFLEARKRLKDGKIVGIFAEGAIANTKSLGSFHRGYELIGDQYDGVIIPVFIDGVFGSMFSKVKREKSKSIFKTRHINVYFAQAMPQDTKVDAVAATILNLKEMYETK